MRRAARVDSNHGEIRDFLRDRGAVVEDHSSWPCGYDVLVHFAGQTVRCEIKDGSLPPSKRRLTENEQQAHDNNPASYAVVTSIEDARGLLESMKAQKEPI